jgi:hypothetical protein
MATQVSIYEPVQLANEERITFKVMAVGGAVGDWAAYIGPDDWEDDKIADYGRKLPKYLATDIFKALDPEKYRE